MNKNSIEIRPIKTTKDYEKALDNIETLISAKRGTATGELLEVLSILVENYEEKHFHIEKLTAREAVQLKMTELGLKQSDLAEYFGGRARVSEFFSGKRTLSLATIKKLNSKFNIPLEFLVYE